jgi:hypothetical protein
MKWMQRSIVALLVAWTLSLGLAGPAAAQLTIQDGLVNVTVGDITILEEVNVAVAAKVVAAICGVKVGPVAVLGRAVDRGEESYTCPSEAAGDTVTILQN